MAPAAEAFEGQIACDQPTSIALAVSVMIVVMTALYGIHRLIKGPKTDVSRG